MNWWKGSECMRGEELETRASKCYDCCDGEANADCNASLINQYKAAADVDSIDSTEFDDSWRAKGKF